jgi:aminoacyl tRNA synthase complex-interacting multifunctional protein 1
MKVTSSAALATLTVSVQGINADPSLQLVVQLASSLQLTVNKTKKASLSLELISGAKLSQRNAIIRCLCGMGLHNALDGSPNYLLGGHSAAVHSSPAHSMAIASISSWMSVADHATTESSLEPLLQQINAHLETRAYLTPSSSVTVADIDVATLLLKKSSAEISFYPNVHRWILAVSASLVEHDIKLPGELEAISGSHGPPMFFYGTEKVQMPKKPEAPQGTAAAEGKPADSGKETVAGGNQAQKQKNTKKQQQQQQPQQSATFDVSALDIRVGKILKVWPHPDAEKLFCEEIDVGEDSPRQIASGLRPFYKQEDLQDRRVIVLCNLKKRNLVGFPSYGMVMCASNADHTQVECMEPPANAKIGERVEFEGISGNPEPENKVAKKKIFESVAPDLKTNAEGVCVWKGATSKTSDGPIKASKGMPDAQVA